MCPACEAVHLGERLGQTLAGRGTSVVGSASWQAVEISPDVEQGRQLLLQRSAEECEAQLAQIPDPKNRER